MGLLGGHYHNQKKPKSVLRELIPTRSNKRLFADLIACSTCFGHHCAHHQELEGIIQEVAACGIWCFGFQVVGMVWR